MRGAAAGLAAVAVAALALPAAATPAPVLAGRWTRVPAAPAAAATGYVQAVWAGDRLLLLRMRSQPGGDYACRYVVHAWRPGTPGWRRLPSSPRGEPCLRGIEAVWTGRQVLVWGDVTAALTPATGAWTPIPRPPGAVTRGIVAWTGRDLVGWGGGCCGDDLRDGWAYRPATGAWRRLPPAPLPPMQGPEGVWTGRELVIAGGFRAELLGVIGRSPYTTTSAAYAPATGTWRRLPRVPRPRVHPAAVWAGDRVLLLGGLRGGLVTSPVLRTVVSYRPALGAWRPETPAPAGRFSAGWAWTGRMVLGWGGASAYSADGDPVPAWRGLAYTPATGRWATLPRAPIPPRTGPAVFWTGTGLLVWGGDGRRDGAVFTPR